MSSSPNLQPSIFSDFTNLYSLTKTLRFELVPQFGTSELVQANNVINKDQRINDLYENPMKPLYDELHLRFITDSLKHVRFEPDDLQLFEEKYKQVKNLAKDRKKNQDQIDVLEEELDGLKQNLRKQTTIFYQQTAEKWKEKYPKAKLSKSSYQILTEKNSLLLLKELYPEQSESIDVFLNFYTYFDGFNQNRANYYTDKAQATGVANRIVNENLIRFLENALNFERISTEIPELATHQESFEPANYHDYLIQEKIDWYNELVVGKINSDVNEHNQQKGIKLPKLRTLYKQIGSEKKSVDILRIESGKEWSRLAELVENQMSLLPEVKSSFQEFFDSAPEFAGYDLDEIYLSKTSVNTISSKWFSGGWQTLAEKLARDKAFARKAGEVQLKDVALAQIKHALETIEDEPKNLFKETYQDYWVESDSWQTFLNIWRSELEKNFDEVNRLIHEFEVKKQEQFDKKIHSSWLKEICDAFLAVERMAKYTKRHGKEGGDAHFYEQIDHYLTDTQLTNNQKYYNAFRNYISQKPYSTDKIKLNFNCGYLLGGWSPGYETYAALIFIKDGKHYLGIINGTKFSNAEIHGLLENINDSNRAKRLVYDFQKPDNKNTPRLFIRSKGDNYAPAVESLNLPIKDIINIYDQGLFKVNKKNPGAHKSHLAKLIDYFKEGFLKHPSYKHYPFSWKESEEYENIADFYDDTGASCYQLGYEEINFEALKKLVTNGRIFLFEITNKDLKEKKNGGQKYNPNLHTTLFLELLKPENTKFLKLLGGGEVFWREKSLEKEKDPERSRDFDIIKNERFTENKYFLHFPVQLTGNRLKESFKDKVARTVQENSGEITYLGLDRGEKHLVYFCLIDSNKNILKQGSFNEINGFDYHDLLTKSADKMMKARKNWDEIGSIKNFKEGYLSQVVHQIYRMVIDHNALVVMEDLNAEFKAKRTAKVEKSVYKKFELALAKKFNHLVLKDRQPNEEGGVLHGYQLTPHIGAGDVGKFEKAKNWGILQYVRAAYTSTTDPVTGWRKNIYLKSSTKEKMRGDILTFQEIGWNTKTQSFYFKYNPKDFVKDEKSQVEDKNYIVYSCVDRIRNVKNSSGVWEAKKYFRDTDDSVTNKFRRLFEQFNIDVTKEILSQLVDNEDLPNDFYEKFIFNLNLILQIRNSQTGTEVDFIQSPFLCTPENCILPKFQADFEPFFFDSRQAQKQSEILGLENQSDQNNQPVCSLPQNGDANGAYHIAKAALEDR